MSEWNEERLTKLRTWWAEGKTASQIAVLFGAVFTRNAIIGKVHRVGLMSRPSPIKARGDGTVPRASGPRIHGRGGKADREAALVRTDAIVANRTVAAPVKVKPLATPSSKPKASPFRTCQWLEGEARLRNFCGAETEPGSPYCPHHHERCYRRADEPAKPAESAAARPAASSSGAPASSSP